MKRIVSVSLGSSARDHSVVIKIGNEDFRIERIGTDGSYEKALNLIRELDGKIDAFGMGGISLYVYGKNSRRYTLHSAVPILRQARQTPMADGSVLKNILERNVVRFLKEELKIPLKDKTVLVVCAMDRMGMAETFAQEGCRTLYGDLAFVLGIPLAIKSLKSLHFLAAVLMSVISRMPIKMLYPSGLSQDKNTPRFNRLFEKADIIAGDFLYIKKYLPLSVEGKIIVTNSVTPKDIEILRERGVKLLVTSTPELDGRSFGTNVMEALACVLIGKRPEEITTEEFERLLNQSFFRHRVLFF